MAHPDAAAAESCPRCGDFACAQCLSATRAGKLCARCIERTGGALWPAGRAMSTLALFGHAIGRLPRHLGLALFASFAVFVPMDVSFSFFDRMTVVSSMLALAIGATCFALLVFPALVGAVTARAVDAILDAPPRPLLSSARRFYGRMVLLGLAMLPALGLVMIPLSLPTVLEASETVQELAEILMVVLPAPIPFIASLATVTIVLDDAGVIAGIRSAVRFAKQEPRAAIGLMAASIGIDVLVAGVDRLKGLVIEREPPLALPFALVEGMTGGVSLVLWSFVFAALYLGRARIIAQT